MEFTLEFQIFYGIIGFSWIVFLFEFYLSIRQRRVYHETTIVPHQIAHGMDAESFEKSRRYSLDKNVFSMFKETVSNVMNTALLVCNGLPYFWSKSEELGETYFGFHKNEIVTSCLFIVLFNIFSTVIGLPISFYHHFVLEEKHGFNKQTYGFFVKDQIKSFIVSLILSIPLTGAVVYIIQVGGNMVFLYLWVFIILMSLFLMTIYPEFIAPLFDKYTPLPDGELKSRIEQLSASVKFPLKKLYVVEGSKRSEHSNAYFYGFFKNKRIVLFDTLLKDYVPLNADKKDKAGDSEPLISTEGANKKGCDTEEVLAVLAHELGHWKYNHVLKSMIVMQLNLLFNISLLLFFFLLFQLKKEFGVANKEREASVMRYVTKESELITARQDREAAEKKYKEAMKEKDNVMAKLKVLSTDKARLTQLYDDKCTEYNILQRSLDKVSDEIAGKDVKLKWVQSKLDKEIETNRQLSDRLQAVEEKQASQVEEASRLKFSEDSQRLFLQEIDVLKKKNQAMTEENNALSLKVQRLEKERLESDESLSKCKSVVNSQNETISGLKNQLANMEDLKNQLHVEHERLLAKDTEVDRVQKSNSELSQDMATCRAREAELLQFTEKLTAKNVRLQSEFSALEAKAEKLEKDVQPLTAQVKLLEEEIASLQSQLGAEKQAKDGDNKALARLVAEKTKQLDQAAKEIEELKSENQIMKRKHASNIRELNKELATLKKKCETYSSGDALGDTHTLGYGSRTSSCQSLNEVQQLAHLASIASTLSEYILSVENALLAPALYAKSREPAVSDFILNR
ncbi:uncharacterized protein LOC103505974 [Diaphorina citri]|uniref:Ste24 endopeptidase n=1 Tax=Diaphorina citri TaxID=121845 RepID=A0A3Q0IQQ7_DIACI|nr:uncharacterized protein LOC103505974 [Diaphorina citri]